MAYSNQLVEYLLQATQTLFTGSVGTDLAWFAPGYQPVTIRGAFAIVGTAAGASGQLNFTTQPTAFSNVGITAGDIAVLKILNSYAAGKVVYFDAISDKKIIPGQSVVLNTKVADTTAKVMCGLSVEPSWETPANDSNMVVTT